MSALLMLNSPMGLMAQELPEEVSQMGSPVICRFCRKPYDLQGITPTGTFSDATVYQTPCCDRQADDREWKMTPDYTRLVLKGEGQYAYAKRR